MTTVSILFDRCTLCGACSDICPTRALTCVSDDESVRLWFRDSQCVPSMCDSICVTHCPENAISLRHEAIPAEAEPVLLAEDSLARCDGCGSPYTSAKVRSHMNEILLRKRAESAMTALNYCPVCRRSRMVHRLEEFVRASPSAEQ